MKVKCNLVVVFLSLFLVGCFEKSPNEELLETSKIQELEASNKENMILIQELEDTLEKNIKSNEVIQESLNTLLIENSTLEELLYQSELKIEELEDRLYLTETEYTGEDIYDINSLEVGSIIKEFRIVDILSDEKSFQIEFEGYYILEGYLALTELGHTYLHFYGDDKRYNPFDFKLRFEDGRMQEFETHIGIINDDVLKRELGEELYDEFPKHCNQGEWLKVPVTILFSDFRYEGYYESEWGCTANIVKILEIEDIE